MSPHQEEKSQIAYGKRLIPNIVDELAQDKPDHVFAQVPKSPRLADGMINVTISTFARAVNRAAHWIESITGKSDDFATVAYLGPYDLRYLIIIVAASKVGLKTLLPSPRNSVEGHASLLDHTDCHTLISDTETSVDAILAKRPMRHLVVDSLDKLLAEGSVAQYPYCKAFEDGASDPFLIVHTSGSTGLPKPITVCQGGLATVDAHHLMSPFDGYGPQLIQPEVSRVFCSLPPFHIAGLILCLAIAIYYDQTSIWPPPGRPISVEVVEDLLDNVAMDSLVLAPSILEEMSQSQVSLQKLKKVKVVGFGGGPLSESAGDKVSRYTNVSNILGSSETCYQPLYYKDPEDWIYFHYNPNMEGIQFRDVGDGVYEQFFVRHPSTDPYHSTWYTFPHLSEVSMKDLFSKHPSKPNLWRYTGRSDDLLVFSNGEKYNPTAMEAILRSHPDVKGAIIVGHARSQPAALLELKGEPPQSEEAKERLFDTFKPYVANLNDSAPNYAKLRRNYVAFTDPSKPMIRTDKGTVKRAATAKLYEAEINQVYTDAESASTSLSTVQLDARDEGELTKALRHMLIQTVGLQDLANDEDIFAAGVDSLQVMNLVRQLRASLSRKEGGISESLISPRIVYSSPTVSKLAAALHGLTKQKSKVYKDLESDRVKKMEAMLASYSPHKLTVVLTGSTGSLGSYILDYLLSSSRVSRVICLNRGTHGEERQKSVNASRGLISDWGARVSFMTTKLGQPRLGLSNEEYDLLMKQASFIIHNQWQVDFNLSLDSFEPQIAGVRDFIELSSQSVHKAPILFTSSIATVENWSSKHPGEKVPEEAFYDFSIPSAAGYGESKYVAERLLISAAHDYGVSAAICRVGQLTGPVEKSGVWSKQEWLPSLVASSKYLGKVPTTIPGQDTVPWVPVDVTARIIVELLLSYTDTSSTSTAWTRYHNIVNPKHGSWQSLIPTITKNLGNIEPVSFAAWYEALAATAARTEDVAKNPGIKLLEWFGGMKTTTQEAELETGETARRSATLKGLEAVGSEWMGIWLRQWDF